MRSPFVRLLFVLPLVFIASNTPAGAQSVPALDLLVLGSGGPGATGRASSSYLVLINGTARILVDAGPGSFARLGEAQVPMTKVDIVLLTHLHIDHAGELPGLLRRAPFLPQLQSSSTSGARKARRLIPRARTFLRQSAFCSCCLAQKALSPI